MNFRRRCSKLFLTSIERSCPRRLRPSVLIQTCKFSTHYDTLGVDKDASDQAIKKAYFKLAKKWHPDVNPSEEAKGKFSEIASAYETLSDRDKRAQYDMFGSEGPQGFSDGFSGGFSSFDDIFSSLFGNAGKTGRSSSMRSAGNDIQVQETLTFMESIKGCKKIIEINRMEKCEVCDGEAKKPGTDVITCRHCGGNGRTSHQQGFLFMEQTCMFCRGQGSTFIPCDTCDGQGLVPKKSKLSVALMEGVQDEMKVRIADQGDASRYNGPRGNLFVHVRVLPHEYFMRNNNDVHVEVGVPLTLAILGGSIQVPTISGKVHDLELDPGVQHGKAYIIRGVGVRDVSSRIHGHQYVHISVEIPKKLTEEQRQVILEYQKLDDSKLKIIQNSDRNPKFN